MRRCCAGREPNCGSCAVGDGLGRTRFEGVLRVAGSLDRKSLERLASGQKDAAGSRETMLDSLLATVDKQKEAAAAQSSSAPLPIERMRELFRHPLAVVVRQVADRYRPKGIDVTMDASDLLGRGRKVVLEISYDGQRLRLNGLVTDDGIAFEEAYYQGDAASTVASGPLLRARQLTEQTFADFLYDQVIKLVRSSRRPAADR